MIQMILREAQVLHLDDYNGGLSISEVQKVDLIETNLIFTRYKRQMLLP